MNYLMRSLLLSAAVVLTFSSASVRAEDIPLDDKTIILGERVGPIKKGMTLTGLKTLFGGGKVKAAKLPGAEGEEIDGVRMFTGTDREIEIIFNPEDSEKEISDIRVIGKGWKFDNGLKLGLTIPEVEKINGNPFKILGFGWDYGGYGNFEGGKLAAKLSIRFDPGDGDIDNSLSGDREIASSNKKLRALNPKVAELTVFFR